MMYLMLLFFLYLSQHLLFQIFHVLLEIQLLFYMFLFFLVS